jgi:methylthioribose-1-phosphate isomerase
MKNNPPKTNVSLWEAKDINDGILVIDQRRLPFSFETFCIKRLNDACFAIREMVVRGAPLIGVTAAYGLYLSSLEIKQNDFENELLKAGNTLKSCRPTAINLSWAIDRLIKKGLNASDISGLRYSLLSEARLMREEDIGCCLEIGKLGVRLIDKLYKKHKRAINILTHCNAGQLACIEHGTATSPIYQANKNNIPIHVWVDETRPRNQGAKLTAWELSKHNIKHTLITDNAGGYLMQQGMVDVVIVGTDRVCKNGDVVNKIGTYLKALAAFEHNIPFYVALPSSSIDWTLEEGVHSVPIETRSNSEIVSYDGLVDGKYRTMDLMEAKTPAFNPGFDITPSKLITAFITEKGVCSAKEDELRKLFPIQR